MSLPTAGSGGSQGAAGNVPAKRKLGEVYLYSPTLAQAQGLTFRTASVPLEQDAAAAAQQPATLLAASGQLPPGEGSSGGQQPQQEGLHGHAVA